ncbi:3862_t:CDS:1, partial [Paraglomus occultum]
GDTDMNTDTTFIRQVTRTLARSLDGIAISTAIFCKFNKTKKRNTGDDFYRGIVLLGEYG